MAGDPRQETFTELHDRAAGQRTTTRRDFMRYAGAGAVMLGGAGGLAACSSSASTATSRGASASPKKGGTLRAGLTGGAASDTVDGQRGVDNVNFARIISLYDALAATTSTPMHQRAGRVVHSGLDSKVWTISSGRA